MHEIGALHEAVKLVEKVAGENHIEQVKSITLEVGELSGYLPIFFEKYFPIVVEDRPILKNAQLHIHTVAGEAICKECQTMYNVMKNEGKCPKCKSREKTILGGTDCIVKDIGY